MGDPETPENKKAKDAAILELKKKAADAFDIFDHEANKTVDSREMGTIIRSLGCCPSEAELKEILAGMVTEDEESSGYVEFDKYLPVMMQILTEKMFKPASDDELMRAFRALDVDNKGYLLPEEVTKFMTEEGEPFTPDELEEMLAYAMDVETGNILYRKYAFTLSPDDEL